VLKSIWLEGKRNQRVDYLIHTLVTEYLPDVEFYHKWQMLGMEGPNLAEKHRQQILMCAPKTPLIKIQKIDNLHFDVQSLNSTKLYYIGLDTTTCSCSDFPHIWLCKHITAVVHFFGGANLGPQPPSNTSSELQPPNSPIQQDGSTGSADDGTTASIILMANDIIGLT